MKAMQAKANIVSPQANLQRCARPPEIPYGIMNDREFLCRRRTRSMAIVTIVMHRSVHIILYGHSGGWIVRLEISKEYLLGGRDKIR